MIDLARSVPRQKGKVFGGNLFHVFGDDFPNMPRRRRRFKIVLQHPPGVLLGGNALVPRLRSKGLDLLVRKINGQRHIGRTFISSYQLSGYPTRKPPRAPPVPARSPKLPHSPRVDQRRSGAGAPTGGGRSRPTGRSCPASGNSSNDARPAGCRRCARIRAYESRNSARKPSCSKCRSVVRASVSPFLRIVCM